MFHWMSLSAATEVVGEGEVVEGGEEEDEDGFPQVSNSGTRTNQETEGKEEDEVSKEGRSAPSRLQKLMGLCLRQLPNGKT